MSHTLMNCSTGVGHRLKELYHPCLLIVLIDEGRFGLINLDFSHPDTLSKHLCLAGRPFHDRVVITVGVHAFARERRNNFSAGANKAVLGTDALYGSVVVGQRQSSIQWGQRRMHDAFGGSSDICLVLPACVTLPVLVRQFVSTQ